VTELVPTDQVALGAITRGGKSQIPPANLILQEHDILQVSATSQGAGLLRQRLHLNGD
jgi:hypothetical protein